MSDKKQGCKARRVCDEWHCHRCALQWDVKDAEPPACRVKSKNKKVVIN